MRRIDTAAIFQPWGNSTLAEDYDRAFHQGPLRAERATSIAAAGIPSHESPARAKATRAAMRAGFLSFIWPIVSWREMSFERNCLPSGHLKWAGLGFQGWVARLR
jgi:hypothetical protein